MRPEEIWMDYRARIKAFLHSKISNEADVEDLLQDISIKVFAGLQFLKDESKLQSWLFQTAHRTIIDHYRRQAKGRGLVEADLWYGEEEIEAGALNDLERCVEPFLSALPSDTAQMLRAIDIDGVKQKDYAAEQGLSYSTLKSRVQKGREELRAVFENCCHLSLDAQGNIMDYRAKSGSCEKC